VRNQNNKHIYRIEKEMMIKKSTSDDVDEHIDRILEKLIEKTEKKYSTKSGCDDIWLLIELIYVYYYGDTDPKDVFLGGQVEKYRYIFKIQKTLDNKFEVQKILGDQVEKCLNILKDFVNLLKKLINYISNDKKTLSEGLDLICDFFLICTDLSIVTNRFPVFLATFVKISIFLYERGWFSRVWDSIRRPSGLKFLPASQAVKATKDWAKKRNETDPDKIAYIFKNYYEYFLVLDEAEIEARWIVDQNMQSFLDLDLKRYQKCE